MSKAPSTSQIVLKLILEAFTSREIFNDLLEGWACKDPETLLVSWCPGVLGCRGVSWCPGVSWGPGVSWCPGVLGCPGAPRLGYWCPGVSAWTNFLWGSYHKLISYQTYTVTTSFSPNLAKLWEFANLGWFRNWNYCCLSEKNSFHGSPKLKQNSMMISQYFPFLWQNDPISFMEDDDGISRT